MFDSLSKKLQGAFQLFSKDKELTEKNLQEAMREVRLALLDADVNFSIANSVVTRIKEKALGEKITQSVSASQQFIKIVHDELVALMGSEEKPLKFKSPLSVIVLCGLQGSGKTTHAAKLALYLKKTHQKRVLLAACDRQRPAAIEQLQTLGKSIDTPVFNLEDSPSALKVAEEAHKHALKEGYDVLLIDTAGRLELDDALMDELKSIISKLNPVEVLFVANAALGQKAASIAQAFNDAVGITGTILTMLDGNARAGSALSILEASGVALRFEGIGEKPEDLQLFNPTSMADRILGMGDTINLVKRAEEHFDQKETEEMQRKLRKAEFTYEDYINQMSKIRKMGSIKGLLKMIPGMSAIGDIDIPEDQLKKTEAIITSMTKKERQNQEELIVSRRKRIARGSGSSIEDVNRLIKGFKRMKDMMKKFPKNKLSEKMLGEKLWQ
jgi:signal recognition particle subunit SRP54